METSRRIERLEYRQKVTIMVFLAVIASLVLVDCKTQATLPENLRVQQITIVDESGKEQVQMAAPLPDPMVQGKRHKRPSPVSGIILLDAKGNERSGYVTQMVELSVLTGPTSALLVAFREYLRILCPAGNQRVVRSVLNGVSGWLTFPFKYLDKWLNHKPEAAHLAAAFYYLGRWG